MNAAKQNLLTLTKHLDHLNKVGQFNYANPRFAEENPEMIELIKNFRLTNEMQAPLIHAVDVGGKDMEEVVDTWLAENEATWKAWLPKTN